MSGRKATHAQLTLPLPVRAALGRGSFYVSESNRLALAQMDGWRGWPGGRLALVGPEGAGKSHLAAVWAAEAGARVVEAGALEGADPAELAASGAAAVEDVDRLPSRGAEETLFHLHERLGAAGGSLLVTSRVPPARLTLRLRDLATRLSALSVARIDPPDDALMEALAVKLFADRQVAVEKGLPRYLALRVGRSHRALAEAVAAVDRAALASGARPSRRLAASVVDGLAVDDDEPARDYAEPIEAPPDEGRMPS